MKLFCLTHREYPNLPNDNITKPLLLGMNDVDVDLKVRDYYPELSKDNLLWNELEGWYYIRHNVDDNIKGQFQYSCRPQMNYEEIMEKLATKKCICHGELVYPCMDIHYMSNHIIEPWLLFRKILDEKGIITDSNKDILKGNLLYTRNILIAPNDLYNEYFDFFWPVINELKERLHINTIEDAINLAQRRYKDNPEAQRYQARIFGYINERLMTIWLKTHYNESDIYCPKYTNYNKVALN